MSPNVHIHGIVRNMTDKAVRFRISMDRQPSDVPAEASGLLLWFPMYCTSMYSAPEGGFVLIVPRALLLKKIAETRQSERRNEKESQVA